MPENFKLILEWILSNMAWEIIIIIFIIFFPSIFGAIKISKFLLHNNRNRLSGGLGTYFADRFIDVWYSSKTNRLNFDRINSNWPVNQIDKQLQDQGLVTVSNDTVPVVNFRNKIIIKILKFYLIYFIGESKEYFKDLKNNKDYRSF